MSDACCAATALIAFSSLSNLPQCARTAMATAHALRSELPNTDGSAVVQLHESMILRKMISRTISADLRVCLNTSWLAVAVSSPDVVEPLAKMLPQDPDIALRVSGYLCTTAFALSRLTTIENMFHILQRAFPYNDGVLPSAALGRMWGQDGQDRRLVSAQCLALFDANKPLRLQQFLPFVFDCTCSLSETAFQGSSFAARVLNSACHELEGHRERAISCLYRATAGGRAPLSLQERARCLGESLHLAQGTNAPYLLHLIVHDSALLEGLGVVGFAATPTKVPPSRKSAMTFALAEVLESFPVVGFCSVDRLRAAREYLDSRARSASLGPPLIGASGNATILPRSTFLEEYCDEFARACLRFEAFVFPPSLPSPVPAAKKEAVASAEKMPLQAGHSSEALASSLGRKKIIFDDEVEAATAALNSSKSPLPVALSGERNKEQLGAQRSALALPRTSPQRSPRDIAAAADQRELNELEQRYSAIVARHPATTPALPQTQNTAYAQGQTSGTKRGDGVREWEVESALRQKRGAEQTRILLSPRAPADEGRKPHQADDTAELLFGSEGAAAQARRFPTPPEVRVRASPPRQHCQTAGAGPAASVAAVALPSRPALVHAAFPRAAAVSPTPYEQPVLARPSPRGPTAAEVAGSEFRELELLELKYSNVLKKQATTRTLAEDRARMEAGPAQHYEQAPIRQQHRDVSPAQPEHPPPQQANGSDGFNRTVFYQAALRQPTPVSRSVSPADSQAYAPPISLHGPQGASRQDLPSEFSRLRHYLDVSDAAMRTVDKTESRIELRQPRQQGRSVLSFSASLAQSVALLQRVGRGLAERRNAGFLRAAVAARHARRAKHMSPLRCGHHVNVPSQQPVHCRPAQEASATVAYPAHLCEYGFPSLRSAAISVKLPTPPIPSASAAQAPRPYSLADVEEDLRREREERLRRRQASY
jgi:hypothetical protein